MRGGDFGGDEAVNGISEPKLRFIVSPKGPNGAGGVNSERMAFEGGRGEGKDLMV